MNTNCLLYNNLYSFIKIISIYVRIGIRAAELTQSQGHPSPATNLKSNHTQNIHTQRKAPQVVRSYIQNIAPHFVCLKHSKRQSNTGGTSPYTLKTKHHRQFVPIYTLKTKHHRLYVPIYTLKKHHKRFLPLHNENKAPEALPYIHTQSNALPVVRCYTHLKQSITDSTSLYTLKPKQNRQYFPIVYLSI